MNYLLRSLVALTALTAAHAETPDFTGVNKASADFIHMLETLQNELPKVNDATGTAKALTTFAEGIDMFADAMQDFAKKYPEISRQPIPPPEFATAYEGLKQMGTKYAAVPTGIGSLAGRFRTDPKVAAAIQKFESSLNRLQMLRAANQ